MRGVTSSARGRCIKEGMGPHLIVKDAAGRPLECACFDGALSTCFDPGP